MEYPLSLKQHTLYVEEASRDYESCFKAKQLIALARFCGTLPETVGKQRMRPAPRPSEK